MQRLDNTAIERNPNAFTVACIIEYEHDTDGSLSGWQRYARNFREDWGSSAYRDEITRFARAIDTAFDTLEHEDQCLVTASVGDFDFYVVPYLLDLAGEAKLHSHDGVYSAKLEPFFTDALNSAIQNAKAVCTHKAC